MSIESDWLNLGLDAVPDPKAQRVRLMRLMLATSAQLRSRLDRELASSGITSQQAAMLQLIESLNEAPSFSTIARVLDMTHQNVKQIAVVLQRKGLLDITMDPLDKRARRLTLTQQHRRLWSQRNPSDFVMVEQLTAGLSDADVKKAVQLLMKLKPGLRRHGPA